MSLTYKELAEILKTLAPEQLEMDVTIFDGNPGEYIPVDEVAVSTDDDVLDKNHPYLTINTIDEVPTDITCPRCKKRTVIYMTVIQDNNTCEVDRSFPSRTQCDECGKEFKITKKILNSIEE